jgi:uncharacterized protein YjbI with pentapeptide repeats
VRFEEVGFKGSGFRNVTLSGVLHTVLFDGCMFENFDFSTSSFRELTFLNANLRDGFSGPSTKQGFVIFDPVDLDRWLVAVEANFDSETASCLEVDLDFLKSTGWPICIDLDSFEELPERSRPSVMAIGRGLVDSLR